MSKTFNTKLNFNTSGGAEQNAVTYQNFISAEDWNFIKSVSAAFPERKPSILERFVTFSWLPPEQRPMLALTLLKEEPRRGLMQRGYAQDQVQSVYDHSRAMSRILGKIFRENSDIREKFPGNRARKILVHDIGEALTTDFTPHDLKRITAEDKVRLEDLAMKLIFEAHPARYEAYVAYKNKETRDDALIKVADTLELLEDIKKMGVSSGIYDEISQNCRKILGKYDDVCRDVKIEPNTF